jgi:hypothetical protein
MNQTVQTALVAAVVIAAGLTWQSVRTASIPVASPDRLVSELRLAQIAALLLALVAGAYIGFATTSGALAAGADIVLAIGFFLAAASTLIRDPRSALTILAIAFAAHAVVDSGLRPGGLAAGTAPGWYAIGCAVFNVYIGVLVYLPILRRSSRT